MGSGRLQGVFGTALALGRSAGRSMFGGVGGRVGAAAISNLKLSAAVLLTGVALIAAMVALPVLLLVFAVSEGVSNGIPLDVPDVIAAGPPLSPGELECPVPSAVVTQPFGPSVLPGEPAMFGYPHFHTGVDLAIAYGTPIHAAEAGQVLDAAGQTDAYGLLVGYGNLVRIVTADNRVEYYGHMSAFAVSRGDLVRLGQVIGFVGSTGYSTGPHVHFEVRVNGTPVDPAPFMQRC